MALRHHRSFTLVEMLVSVAVLSLLLVIIATLTSSASRVADATGRHADAVEEARQVLDRIDGDLAAMLLRPDVDAVFAKQAGNDALFFYSQVPGYFTGIASANRSPVSLVGYRIAPDNSTSQPALQRLAQGIAWSGSGAMNFLTVAPSSSLTFPATNPGDTNSLSTIAGQWQSVIGSAPYDKGGSSSYHTIGSQVFRFEFCFLRRDGTYSTTPGSLSQDAAIVVAVAVLDEKSRRIASSLDGLASALPDIDDFHLSASPPVLMEDLWNKAVLGTDFASKAGIPPLAASQVRVFQRFYYLNLPPSQ